MTYELGIVGAGNMAEAIVRGVLGARVLTPAQIIAADVAAARRNLFAEQLGVPAVEDATRAAADARIVLLSIKPQKAAEVLEPLGKVMNPDALVVSIMAGISSAAIARYLGGSNDWRIVRTMPNTPMLVGEGMVAIAPGRHATAQDLAATRRIFEAAATVIELDEQKMDAVTAISGSGPAYFFLLVEQMIRTGVELGLTAEQAHALATRTAAGAAKMLLHSPDSPEELRRKVTSPGGTTQAAIETMQARGVPESIVAALHRAAQRSRELGC